MGEGFKKLIVWQRAYSLVVETYRMTERFPNKEQYCLVPQTRRAALSIIANISEGYERNHRKEYIRFLVIAKGSLGELETFLMLAKDLGYIDDGAFARIEILRKETAKTLTGLIRSLKKGPWTLASGP